MESMKESKIPNKSSNEIIQAKISSLEEEIKVIDQKIEPLHQIWERLMMDFNIVKGNRRRIGTKKEADELELRLWKMKEDRDKNPDVVNMWLLTTEKNNRQDEIRKLSREQYENSLNELKSQVTKLCDKTYNDLDSLNKELVEPLKAYGMTDKAAKKELGWKSDLFYNLEEKIKILENILSDIENFLAEKRGVHSIESLKEQLKSSERFDKK